MIVPLERFRDVAQRLSELVQDGPVALRVLRPFTPFSITFDVHFRDQAVASAVDGLGLTRNEFQAAVSDIQEVLASLAQGVELDRSAGEEGTEDRETTQEKIRFIEGCFDMPSLQRRWWVKANAKNQLLFESGWDVSLKVLDEAQRPPGDEPVPAGLLALKGSRFSTPLSIFDSGNTELVLAVDREDIKAIMQTLRRLDEALTEAEQSDDEADV
jgi:hypothetical protein